MQLNSLIYVSFFVAVFAVYYLLGRDRRWQNAILLGASYLFYGYIDIRMLPLLVGMSLLVYYCGLKIQHAHTSDNPKQASRWSTVSVVLCLLPLLYFKYFDFFLTSFQSFLSKLGFGINFGTLELLLPLGISFFTFRLISYVVEVNRHHIKATTDLLSLALYVGFFPTMLSGPIDRPKPFLAQLSEKRSTSYEMLLTGLKRFVWGWFIKVCIADRIGLFTEEVFGSTSTSNSATLLTAALLYPLQLYSDFCGYSHIAIGSAQMLGIKVAENFRQPFFSQNIADYWRRWHISLTSWLTDYVFTPLNLRFRDWGKWGMIFAVMVNFLAVGLWHGANWTFVVFGLYHGLLFIPLILSSSGMRKSKIRWLCAGVPAPLSLLKMALTYVLVAVGLVVFRAPDLESAIQLFKQLFSFSGGGILLTNKINIILFSVFLLLMVVKDAQDAYGTKRGLLKSNKAVASVCSLLLLIVCIILFRGDAPEVFIYQQF